MTYRSRTALVVVAALAAGASIATAEPINRYTITGRSAAAASAQGVPLDQTPRPAPAPEAQQAAGGGAIDAGAAPEGAQAPAKPRVVRYGLLGLSWRSE